jgi:hypothetical protein
MISRRLPGGVFPRDLFWWCLAVLLVSGCDRRSSATCDSKSESKECSKNGDDDQKESPRTDETTPTGSPGSEHSSSGNASAGAGQDRLKGYWVWEKRVQGAAVQSGPIDKGQMRLAFGTGNNRCHYIWNETTGSDFHTECTYTISKDLVTFSATADSDKTAAGYSCAHPDWTSWNDRPAVEYGRFKFVGDRLWIGVNTYWGFGGGVVGVPANGSLKRFPFWESQGQAETLESWIVFKPVSRAEWFGRFAISSTCQGSADLCAKLPGCGAGEKPYVD